MFYKCPNCGRIYNYGCEGEIWAQCLNCRYPLKKAEDVKKVAHPELNEHKIIGTVEPVIFCPYCRSTNVNKISFLSRLGSAELWGLGSGKIGKQFHCNRCGANF